MPQVKSAAKRLAEIRAILMQYVAETDNELLVTFPISARATREIYRLTTPATKRRKR